MMFLDIPQMDVFTEDYSSVFSVIENAAKKENGLLELRSSWEILFSAYDDDPREIPDIPEVANWIRKSVSAGVPWLYLLRQEKEPDSSLILFVIICCGRSARTRRACISIESSSDSSWIRILRTLRRSYPGTICRRILWDRRQTTPWNAFWRRFSESGTMTGRKKAGRRLLMRKKRADRLSAARKKQAGGSVRIRSAGERLPAVWTKRTGRRFGTSRLRRQHAI